MKHRTMRRLGMLLAAGAFVAAGAQMPQAQANHCAEQSLVLNSGTGATAAGTTVLAPQPQPHPFPACSLDWAAHSPVDTRVIPAGSTHVSPAYLRDLGWPTLTATLHGMGFNGQAVTLNRVAITGGHIYSANWVPVPGGVATVGGTIRVEISGVASNTFRTAV